MSTESPSPAGEWLIRPAESPPFVYNPRFHSRRYVLAYLDRVRASAAEAESILRQADQLEQRAVALGYQLAIDRHGEDESRDVHTPSFTPPGPGS